MDVLGIGSFPKGVFGFRTLDFGLWTPGAYGKITRSPSTLRQLAQLIVAAMRDHTKIEAWKLADDVAVVVYAATRDFPRAELYGITSQLRRAAVSVPANIAEGSARGTQKDYLHFLYIARGSAVEVQYLIHLCGRLGLITFEERNRLVEEVCKASRCLQGLINAVEKEAGRIVRAIATVTSLLVLTITRSSIFGLSCR
jgi:four helix bundle protein